MSSHILLAIEGTWPWYRGGVSEWIHRYIKAFPELKFDILQIATDQYLNTKLSAALYSVPEQVGSFTRIPPPALGSGNWEAGLNQWFDTKCSKLDKVAANCDIVHSANTGFAGWTGKVLAERRQKPFIVTEHALYWKEVEMGAAALECGYKVPKDDSSKKAMTNMFKKLAADVYRQADEIVSVSRCNIEAQRLMGAESPRYIPNGVSRDWLVQQNKRSGPLTMGWIGRCAEMKDPLRFMNLAREFNRAGGDTRFIMMLCYANEPDLQDKVMEEAKHIAHLSCYWNQPAETHLDEMDALCISSRNESQPLVLFEALAKKVLPVGWEAGDVTPEYGLILPQDASITELVKLIRHYWKDQKTWKMELNRRFERVQSHHTWAAVFRQYKTLFNPYLKD